MSIFADGTTEVGQVLGDRSIDISTSRGQQGFFLSRAQWAASARHVKQRMMPFLQTVTPLAKYLDDPEGFERMLRSLIEERAIDIQGINFTMNATHNETVEGNAGEMRETFIATKYDRSVPNYTWPEVKGKAVHKFWEWYMRTFMGNPDTGIAEITLTEAYRNDPNPLPLTEENMSFVVLYVEASDDLLTVVNAAMVANHQPKSSGENTLSRTIGEDMEAPVVQIEFTGMTDRSPGVYTIAAGQLQKDIDSRLDPERLATMASYVEERAPSLDAAENGFFGS